MRRNVLIPGVSGLLGLNLAMIRQNVDNVVGTVLSHQLSPLYFEVHVFDLSVPGSGQDLVRRIRPDLVVNCAALASLETCEKQPELAWRLNAELPGELAESTLSLGIPFIHISTDAVFDGKNGNYSEEETTNPINTYGRSKLAGEKAVHSVNSEALIARVNFYGWSLSGTKSLCEFFYNNLRDGQQINGFIDLFYSPMMVADLIDTLFEMIDKKLHGIYHVSSDVPLSKYAFGCRLANEFGFDPALIKPISYKEIGFRTDRSLDLTLNVNKLIHDLGHPVPGVTEGLKRLHIQEQNGYATVLRSLSNK